MDDLEHRLRTAVTQRADDLQPDPDLPRRIHARVARRRRQRQMRAGALATVLLAAVAAGVLARAGGPEDTEAADPVLPAPTATEPARPGTTAGTTETTAGPDAAPPGSDTAPGSDTTATADPGGAGDGEPAEPPETAPTTGQPTETRPPATTGTTAEPGAPPSGGPEPAIAGCSPASGAVVVITLRPAAPSPGCVEVRADQSLRVRNDTGRPVDVSLAHHAATVPAGGARSFTQPFGDYLRPGVHQVTTSLYGPDDPELHLPA